METLPTFRAIALFVVLLAGAGWHAGSVAESPDQPVSRVESSTAEQVDVNRAKAGVLAEALDGVGSHRAEAIVAYRNEHGDFESAGELLEVKGIGEATLEKNRDKLAF